MRHLELQLEATSAYTCSSKPWINKLFESVLKAAKESRINDAIEQASTALKLMEANDELRTNTIKMLHLRATCWAKKRNTKEELKDANRMIQLAPKLSTGYIYAGEVHAAQGYQESAMEIFDKGLIHVLRTDLHYTLLREKHAAAKARLERRIDFVSCSPYDIMPIILGYLTTDDIVNLVHVSRAWRNVILDNPLRWKTFEIRIDSPTHWLLLSMVSQHIEQLKVKLYLRSIRKCLGLIGSNRFPKLRSLEVGYLYSESNTKQRYPGYMHDALSATSETLTHLHFHHIDVMLPPLANILSTCQSLTSVQITHRGLIADWLTELSLSHTTTLVRLSLTSALYEERNVDQIGELLRCSPALEYLKFDGYSANVLPIVAQHSANLKRFIFNSTAFGDKLGISVYTSDNHRQLALGGRITPQLILPLLQRFQSTLEVLFLSPKYINGSEELGWQLLSATSLPSLMSLFIRANDTQVDTVIADLIHQSLGLKDITLHGFEEETTNGIVEAIRRFNKVESLAIHNSNIGGAPLVPFLRGSQLRRLEIYDCDGLTYDLFMGVAEITSLEHLRINDLKGHMADKMYDFTRRLGILPCLKKIVLGYMRFNVGAVQNLCVSKSLKAVIFDICQVSDEELHIFRQHDVNIMFSGKVISRY